MKIKGPDKPKKQNASKEPKQQQGKDLRTFFPSTNKQISSTPKLSDANNVKGFNNGTSGVIGVKGVCSNYSLPICACKAFIFFVGPIKTNGGGILLLNPKTKAPVTKPIDRQTSIASAFPPSSYPGLSSDPFNTNTISGSNKTPIRHTSAGGNLRNVIGFANLNSSPDATTGAASRVNANSRANAAFSGSGCQVGATGHLSACSKNSPSGEVDRNHLRELWLKRFDKNKTNRSSDTMIENNKKNSRFLESDAEAPAGEGTVQLFTIDLMKYFYFLRLWQT